jgi:uncharacterized membrane protein YraQ (UPF0718 family)
VAGAPKTEYLLEGPHHLLQTTVLLAYEDGACSPSRLMRKSIRLLANQTDMNNLSPTLNPGTPRSLTAGWTLGGILQVCLLILSLGLLLFSWKVSSFRTLAITFVSIVIEAFPFILVGSLIGGFIEEFIPRERLALILPEGKLRTVFIAAAMGIVFPVCECAIIPVVRRLLKKGVPFSAAVAFLLGAPIFNPVVFASTAVAYRFDWAVPITRLFVGYVIAVVLGVLTGFLFKRKNPLLPETPVPDQACRPCCPSHHPPAGKQPSRLVGALVHAGDDFIDVARFLVLGAFVAALIQGVLPRASLLVLADQPLLSLLPMMILAMVLNLCSEADAFVAASFRFVVPMGGQMAFMVLGPMLDIKLIFIYLGVFRKRVIAVLGALIFIAVLAATALLSIFGWIAG